VYYQNRIFVTDLKTLLASILIFTFVGQSFFQSAFLGYWKINQGEIIKTECINRFKPMMHCNGKCYLYRQLKKAADDEAASNKVPLTILKLKGIDDCIVDAMVWQPIVMNNIIKRNLFKYPETTISNGYNTSLLKPPQV
jgi:hypothetical protein